MPDDAAPRRGPPGRGDLTQGGIGSTLLKFALPTLASSILQSLNGTINSIWVGRFLGEGALAATSNANMVMFLMTAFVFGFGMASTILVGQYWGRKDVEGARRVFGTAMGSFATHLDRHRHCRLFPRPIDPQAAGDARRRGASRARLPPRDLPRDAGAADADADDDGAPGLGGQHDALVVHAGRGPARQRPQPGVHPRARAGAAARHRRVGDGDADRQLHGAAGPRRLHLHPRPAAPAARERASLPLVRPRHRQDDHRQGLPDGPADDHHLALLAGAGRSRQPRGRRHDRCIRGRAAVVDLRPDAGDGARRRGQCDGRAEHRRRPVGPGEQHHPRRASSRHS